MAGLYIHIPFCKQACYYCDFHFSTSVKFRNEIVQSIAREINIQKNYLKNEPLETIYFGGGTPSILKMDELTLLFEAIYKNFSVSNNPEITLEANPDDLTKNKLSDLHHLGINRLSIGIQSFNDQHLKYLHRVHNAHQAIDNYHQARSAGFENISIDLIFAIPSHNHDIWEKDLEMALSLTPEHISCYNLTIEPRTVFGNWLKKGKIASVDEDFSAEQFKILMDAMSGHDYDQYEISNFSKENKFSKHNTSYWQFKKYLGVGPAAHSFDGSTRQFNVSNNQKYLKSINEGVVPFENEKLTKIDLINEYMLTSLRTKWGCDLEKLRKLFEYDLFNNQKDAIEKFIGTGLIKMDGDTLLLTQDGKFLADRIIEDLFLI